MQDEIIPPISDGQPERDDFAKTPKDLKYPSNSLYYSGPSKIIETHVTNKERDMKDEHWVDSIRPKQHTTTFTDSIYEGMSDESLLEMKQKVSAEWDRRQQERFTMLLKIRKQLNSHMVSHGITNKELQDD